MNKKLAKCRALSDQVFAEYVERLKKIPLEGIDQIHEMIGQVGDNPELLANPSFVYIRQIVAVSALIGWCELRTQLEASTDD